MKLILLFIIALSVSQLAFADITENYGWEGAETVLGIYPADTSMIATIALTPVHGGSQSLCLEDNAPTGTPQAYVAWIVGLQDGDVVTASFWRYDTTPAAAPSCRISAHWNDDPGDIMGFNGAAGYNSDYGPGTGWDQTTYDWTVVDGHTGLVIEARTYSNAGDIVWIDDLSVTSPDGTTIRTPEDVSLEASTWAEIKAIF